jgi:hypothetical protein
MLSGYYTLREAAMKKITILIILMISIPSLAFAGEIYGNIRTSSGPVGSGVSVEIKIGDKVYSTRTDRYGSYGMYVTQTGPCILTVKGTRSCPSIEVYSYKSSVRYDLVLFYRDRKWHLRKK